MNPEHIDLNHFAEKADPLSDYSDLYSSESHVAGKVSFNTSAKNDYLTNEAFKSLRTNILFCGTELKTILITSSHENEGKSTVSSELCKSFAEIEKRVLLIDADLRKSVMLRKNSRTHDISGLSELLSDQASLEQVLYNTQHPNFDVIFCGHFPPNPVELVGSTKFKSLLDKLRESYDYIIIDTPPLGVVIDAAVMAAVCDGAILVVGGGKTRYREALEVKNQLTKSGCRLLGAILNQTEPNAAYYRRYYQKQKYEYYAEQPAKKSSAAKKNRAT